MDDEDGGGKSTGTADRGKGTVEVGSSSGEGCGGGSDDGGGGGCDTRVVFGGCTAPSCAWPKVYGPQCAIISTQPPHLAGACAQAASGWPSTQ